MAIAKGKSCVMAELDILKETLENMITSIEATFKDVIDSLKSEIFDIERDITINQEERNSLSSPFYDELGDCLEQRYISRNKLIICIYSICEATLASICEDFKCKIVKEPGSESRLKKSPNLKGIECNVKGSKNTNYYLNDYLYSLNPNYKNDWKDANTICDTIRKLRNYLTHCKSNNKQAMKIVEDLLNNGFEGIQQLDGRIMIKTENATIQILDLCLRMLVEAERIAKERNNTLDI